MKIKNDKLLDMKGKEIVVDDEVLTVATALMNAAISQPLQARSGRETIERYDCAIALYRARKDDEIEIELDTLQKIKEDLPRIYGVVVAGQVLNKLEGKQ